MMHRCRLHRPCSSLNYAQCRAQPRRWLPELAAKRQHAAGDNAQRKTSYEQAVRPGSERQVAVAGEAGVSQQQQKRQPRLKSKPVGNVMRIAELSNPSSVAAAINHKLAEYPKVLLMAVGANAVYTAVKAVATARKMAQASSSLDIAMQPSLQPNSGNIRDRHCIRLYLYSVPLRDLGSGGPDAMPILRVQQTTDVNRLAGSVTSVLQGGASCSAMAAGAVCTYRAIRGIAVARYLLLRKEAVQDGPSHVQGRRQPQAATEVPTTTSKSASDAGQAIESTSQQRQHGKGAKMYPSAPAMDLMAFPQWQQVQEELWLMSVVVQGCGVSVLEQETNESQGGSPVAAGLQIGNDDDSDVQIAPRMA